MGVFALWVKFVFLLPKKEYNPIHPITSWIPISCYILMRNIVPQFRKRVSNLLVWLGGATLETYLLQLHVYMCDDAKVLIAYPTLSNYPLVNFMVASAVFLSLSKILFNCTKVLNNVFSSTYPQ
eukprot:TRINITY_DN589_c0_g1_i1.p1 TRINITY_DN589_c0_g1~~TRINITY_DN589_c0_g1_i1.p1  ORF type:complete len:124 (+),score=10.99 TRINITY_DN589_c0_g1_i1:128-499(+)